MPSLQKPISSSHRRLGRSLSQKDLSKLHDDYSSQSSALTDDEANDARSSKNMIEKTIRVVYAQKKAEHPTGDDVNSGLFEAMRKELRYAVDEIKMELEHGMVRKTSTLASESSLRVDDSNVLQAVPKVRKKYIFCICEIRFLSICFVGRRLQCHLLRFGHFLVFQMQVQIESRPQKKHPLRIIDDSNKGSARYFDYLFYIDFEASMAELLLESYLIISFITLQIFYFIGFAFFSIESVISIWVIQDVYMYFRGSGKAAEMKREATKQTMMAALP